jgi:hypothetical protein
MYGRGGGGSCGGAHGSLDWYVGQQAMPTDFRPALGPLGGGTLEGSGMDAVSQQKEGRCPTSKMCEVAVVACATGSIN